MASATRDAHARRAALLAVVAVLAAVAMLAHEGAMPGVTADTQMATESVHGRKTQSSGCLYQ